MGLGAPRGETSGAAAVGGGGTEPRHGNAGRRGAVTDGGSLLRGDMGSQVDMKGAPDGDALRRAWGDIEAGVGLGEPGGEGEPRPEGSEATTREASGRDAGQGRSGPHWGPPRTTPRVVMVATLRGSL